MVSEVGQCSGPFAKFLKKCGIRAQYTMSGIPQQNGACERRNRTLMDLVKGMMNTSLPKSLQAYGLQTAMYLLNKVPNKVVPETSFELWTDRKPSLKHLHVQEWRLESTIYMKINWLLLQLMVWSLLELWFQNHLLYNGYVFKVQRI